MSTISLTSTVRTSLGSLKSTSSQLEKTTNRLSTGKKVANAIDNPTNYFAAKNYTDRADALESRLDSMSEATEMINAADNGITSIKAYLSQMKGIVNNALSNTDSGQRRDYGEQFNELITQIQDVASDSSYGGINLINGNASTTVQFGENIGDSDLTLQGFNISSADADPDANGEIGSSAVTGSNGNAYALTLDLDGTDVVGIQSAGTNGVGGGTPNANLTSLYNHLSGFTLTPTSTATDIGAVLNDTGYLSAMTDYLTELTGKSITVFHDATFGTKFTYDSITYGALHSFNPIIALYHTIASDVGYTDTNNPTYFLLMAVNTLSSSYNELTSGGSVDGMYVTDYNDEMTELGTQMGSGTSGRWSIDWGADSYQDDLTNVIGQIEKVDSTLQTQSSKLANNLAIITQREDYTNNSIDILNNGADDLTLANLNEEGANLISLQTSESLAVQALSLSSASASNVLSIIR